MTERPKPIRLTEEQERRINAALRELHDLLPEIDRLKACGVECQEHSDMVAFLNQRLNAFKMNFGSIPVS
jgi:hypothetical protein